MRRQASRLPEGTGKVAGRQAAIVGQVDQRDVTLQICGESFLSSLQLPGSESTAERPDNRLQAAIGYGGMNAALAELVTVSAALLHRELLHRAFRREVVGDTAIQAHYGRRSGRPHNSDDPSTAMLLATPAKAASVPGQG